MAALAPHQRPYYQATLDRFRGTPGLIKVLTGVRRCGKSTLLTLLRHHLEEQGVAPDAMLSLNFESMDLAHVDSAQTLHDLVRQHPFPPGQRYLFLDEVQLVPGWERAVNSLRLDERFDIYLTGSNSRMLASNLATLLSGRYVVIEVFPLSFAEHCQVQGAQPTPSAFNGYLRTGGLPGLLTLPDDAVAQTQYLDGVLSTVLTKDIVTLQQVRDVDALLKVARYLAANVGNLVNARAVADYLTSSGRRISADTVDSYLRLLEDAFLFYRAKREDLRGKEILKTNDKFYLVDPGLRAVTTGLGTPDVGRLIENVVYLELRRRNQRVSVGKHGATEIDFVTYNQAGGIHYYQVTQTMSDATTRDRELRPLQAMRDNYPKTVLSLDEVRDSDYEGIHHEYLLDWLVAG